MNIEMPPAIHQLNKVNWLFPTQARRTGIA
jgi:hypothetical protein